MKKLKRDGDKIIYCACKKIARYDVEGELKCKPSCGINSKKKEEK